MSADLRIRDLAVMLLQMLDEAQTQAAAGDDFAKGRKFGLAQALSLLQQEALIFGLDTAELGFPKDDAMLIAMRD